MQGAGCNMKGSRGRKKTKGRKRGDVRIKIDSSVGKLAELPFLLELGGLLSVLEILSSASQFSCCP